MDGLGQDFSVTITLAGCLEVVIASIILASWGVVEIPLRRSFIVDGFFASSVTVEEEGSEYVLRNLVSVRPWRAMYLA